MTWDKPWPNYNPDDPEDVELAAGIRELEKRRMREAQEDRARERREREEQVAREAEAAARKAALAERLREQEAWEPPFVHTSAAGLVFSTIERCLRFGHNALIVGAPGVGKTRALEEAVRRSDDLEGPSVGFVHVTSIMGKSTMALFEEVAPHLGVKPAHSISATLSRLHREACFAPVMLFDEAQNLSAKSIRELLEISKKSRVQMVFIGNDEVLKLVDTARPAFQQISRRIAIREEINCILDTDADLIANLFNVEGMDAYRLCRQLARAYHADGLRKVLPVARHLASDRKRKTVQLAEIEDALATFPHLVSGLRAAQSVPAIERQSSFKRLPPKR